MSRSSGYQAILNPRTRQVSDLTDNYDALFLPRQQQPDPIGQQFPNPENAKAHASRIAREIAQDEDWDGYSVVVVDEHGNEIARVPVQD